MLIEVWFNPEENRIVLRRDDGVVELGDEGGCAIDISITKMVCYGFDLIGVL